MRRKEWWACARFSLSVMGGVKTALKSFAFRCSFLRIWPTSLTICLVTSSPNIECSVSRSSSASYGWSVLLQKVSYSTSSPPPQLQALAGLPSSQQSHHRSAFLLCHLAQAHHQPLPAPSALHPPHSAHPPSSHPHPHPLPSPQPPPHSSSPQPHHSPAHPSSSSAPPYSSNAAPAHPAQSHSPESPYTAA